MPFSSAKIQLQNPAQKMFENIYLFDVCIVLIDAQQQNDFFWQLYQTIQIQITLLQRGYTHVGVCF